jgi:hypothetical protein
MAKVSVRKRAAGILATIATLGLLCTSAGAANAATTIDGPIDLGSAGSFGVLGASTVTNTGSSVIAGDLGLSPGTEVTGFPPGIVAGTQYVTNEVAAQAQSDLTTAFNVASSLTPTATGHDDLVGLSLPPGVYSGGELSLSGQLTLAGSAESVWVFQAASTLTTGPGSRIVLTGGANACNVFWEIGSSATLGTGSQFAGTIMAKQSITATTGATVTGRLLADNGAVTLDTNTITTPTGCAKGGAVSTSPVVTSSAPSAATVGTDYSFTVAASGTPTPTFAVSSGSLPAGLHLDVATGIISGVPTTPGTSSFTISASNGTAPAATVTYSIVTSAAPPSPTVPSPTVPSPTVPSPTVPSSTVPSPDASAPALGEGAETLAATGVDVTLPLSGGGVLLALGVILIALRRKRIRTLKRA